MTAVILQLFVNALITAAVYVLLASGLSLIYSTTRVFHLAHGGVMAFGAYVFWYAASVMHIGLSLAALIGIAASVLVGILVNELVYEPLRRRKAKGLAFLMGTLAALMFLHGAVLVLFGAQTQTLNLETASYTWQDVRITALQILIIFVALVAVGFLSFFSNRTKLGKAMRAVADNETMAQVLGVRVRSVRRFSFILGSFFGGIAGVLVALEFNLEPNMGVMLAIKAFTALVIGGSGSAVGAMTGSLLVSVFEQVAVWFWGAGWKSAMAFVLLFVFLLVRPQGILGRKKFL